MSNSPESAETLNKDCNGEFCNKQNENKVKCRKELRNMIEEDDLLKYLECDDLYLERFLVALDYDVKNAFQRMKDYYQLLVECPNWFTTEGPSSKKQLIEKDIRVLLQTTDNEGRPIYMAKLCRMNPSTMAIADDVAAVDNFFLEAMFLENDSIKNGLCVIVDVANFPWNITTWFTPSNIRTVIRKILALPIKGYRFHLINNSFLIHGAIKILWPFVPQHLKDMIQFHFGDFESFYNFFEKDNLPVEYGGKVELDTRQLHLRIFKKEDEIIESFRITRTLFLEKLKSSNENVLT